MLVFVIPLKPKVQSGNWKLTSSLCERAIKSACAQTNESSRVVLVCNEAPDLVNLTASEKRNLSIINVPNANDFGHDESLVGSTKVDKRKEDDKAEKIKIGFAAAVSNYSASYLMALDADDCVSNRLADYVISNSNCAGWFAQQGYVYTEGSKVLLRRRFNFQAICGSGLIVRSGLWPKLFTETDGLSFYNHGTRSVTLLGLKPLPFPMSIYSVNNGENYHFTGMLKKRLVFGREYMKIAVFIRRMINYRFEFVRKSITERFGLYQV